MTVPYDEIDPNIAALVRALNAFEGVTTVGSCGGHEEPTGGGWPAGCFYVKFTVDRSDAAWLALEFLTWAINHDGGGDPVQLVMDAYPPFMNTPGEMLSFIVEGRAGADPDRLAAWIEQLREDYFCAE